MDWGLPFTHLQSIPFPQDTMLRQTLQMQLWDFALEHESYQCFHTLSLYTDPDILMNVLELTIYYHEIQAIIPVLACLYRHQYEIQLGNIQCSEKQCKSCAFIREQLLNYFEFQNDWQLVRKKLKEARKRNLWIMWKPQLLLNPQTDAITKKIFQTTKKGWNTVFAATMAAILWRRWMERQLNPTSSYVNNVLAKRFSRLSQQY